MAQLKWILTRPMVLGPGYLLLLGLWTYKLLEPKPLPENFLGGFSWFDREMLLFLLAKTLHFGAYAFLAFVGSFLAGGTRFRCCIYLFLILHGIATEIGQMYVPNRFGCIRDMIIDAVGVAVGAIAWQRWGKSLVRTHCDDSNHNTLK
ncbi:MAG: VanZ family protein [Gemmataceae bacterium]